MYDQLAPTAAELEGVFTGYVPAPLEDVPDPGGGPDWTWHVLREDTELTLLLHVPGVIRELPQQPVASVQCSEHEIENLTFSPHLSPAQLHAASAALLIACERSGVYQITCSGTLAETNDQAFSAWRIVAIEQPEEEDRIFVTFRHPAHCGALHPGVPSVPDPSGHLTARLGPHWAGLLRPPPVETLFASTETFKKTLGLFLSPRQAHPIAQRYHMINQAYQELQDVIIEAAGAALLRRPGPLTPTDICACAQLGLDLRRLQHLTPEDLEAISCPELNAQITGALRGAPDLLRRWAGPLRAAARQAAPHPTDPGAAHLTAQLLALIPRAAL